MGRLFCWVICTASKAYLVLNTKLFLSHTSFSSLLVCIICKISCHPAFAIHLVFDLGHSSSPTSLLACEYHKLFVPTCHTSLMEQTFSFSSSSLSVCYIRIQFSVFLISMLHQNTVLLVWLCTSYPHVSWWIPASSQLIFLLWSFSR